MHIDDFTVTTKHPHPVWNFIANGSLIILALAFDVAQETTADDIYKWVYRVAALLSLGLLIYINWNRAKDVFKNNKNNATKK